jgi:hypothetical protein
MNTFPTLRSLYRQYLDALPKAGVRACSDGPEWTSRVKQWWARKGTEYGFRVWANHLDLENLRFHKKEFMIDVLWEINTRQRAQIQMALECEWAKGMDDILWDFRKLVYVKARQKVMIFQSSSRREPHNIDELASVIGKCRIKQEPAGQYLLIRHRDHRPEPGRLVQWMRGYIVDEDGSCKALGEEREIVIT